jgi:hypothetical protein
LVPHWDVLSIAWKCSKYRFWVCSNDLILRTSPLWRFSDFFSKWCSKYLSVAINLPTCSFTPVYRSQNWTCFTYLTKKPGLPTWKKNMLELVQIVDEWDGQLWWWPTISIILKYASRTRNNHIRNKIVTKWY